MKHLFLTIIALLSITSINAQEAVDLGLSVDWAAYNIGAESIEDGGKLYLVGTDIESVAGKNYRGVNLPIHKVDFSGNPALDLSTRTWGENWRTPTSSEWNELMTRCSWRYYEYVNDAGIKCYGYEVTGPNGNSIILPSNNPMNPKFGWYQCSTPKYGSKKMATMTFSPKRVYVWFWKYTNKYSMSFGAAYRPVIDKE